MATINGKACVVDGKPVDKVFSNGKPVYGRNLWIRSKAVSGYLTVDCGVNRPDAENLLSDFISVHENQTYIYSTEVVPTISEPMSATWDGYAFFDSNKAPLGGRKAQSGPYITVGTPQHTEWIIKPPVDASFIRIGSRYLQHGTAKLEVGSAPTPWTPAPEDVLNGYIAAQQVWQKEQDDWTTVVTADSQGNVYFGDNDSNILTKLDSNGDFAATIDTKNGIYSLTVDVEDNVYIGQSGNIVTKISKNGEILWQKKTGSAMSSLVLAIAVNNLGVCVGGSDNLVKQLNRDGGVIWSKDVGKAVYAVASDKDNNVYASINYRIFIKFDISGNVLWQKSYSESFLRGLVIDSLDCSYLTEDTNLYKYDSEGTQLWKKTLSNRIYGLAMDNQDNVYVMMSDYIEKYSSDGTFIWKTAVTSGGSLYGLCLDRYNNVYVGNEYKSIYKFMQLKQEETK